MSVNMKPTSEILVDLGLSPNGRTMVFMANTCMKHMDKYVPKRHGDLREQAYIDGDCVVYDQKYARYQYHGVRKDGTHQVQHYTTPGTGPYWDKRMVSAEINDVVREVQDYINRGGK